MNILHIAPTFYPATQYGGPIYTVLGLCDALARIAGVELRVLTTDSAAPKSNSRLTIDSFPQRFPAGYDVYYCRSQPLSAQLLPDLSFGLLLRLAPMIRWADVVHLTAVYSAPTIPTLLICKLLAKPLVWSPRGAWQRWHGSTRVGAKRIWDTVCNALVDEARVVLHFTSEQERESGGERINKARKVVIPNGIAIEERASQRAWQRNRELRLLYLGRLHPIKGIENLLRALCDLGSDVSLSIYGDGALDYRERLKSLVAELDLQSRVHFGGHVSGAEKTRCFERADVCVVPSFTENFGMVVLESLAHGVPVIASTGTPWREIEARGCGYWVENSPSSLADAIRRIRQQDLSEMGKRGRIWAEERFSWAAIGSEMFGVYRELQKNFVGRKSIVNPAR